jgi:predicted MFS family arabinose efflux permease
MTQVVGQAKYQGTGAVIVGVLTAATIVSFVHRYLPSVLVDSIRSDVDITDVQFASLQSAFAFTYAAATLVAGYVTDKTNRRNLVAAGIVLWTAGTFIFAFAENLNTLLGARMMTAFGEALLGPAGLSLLCDFVPPNRRGRAIAFLYFGVTLGTSLAFSGGGAMLDFAKAGTFNDLPGFAGLEPWREVMLLLGALGLFLIPLVLTFREPTRSFDIKQIDKNRFDDIWKLGRVFWLVLFTGSSIAMADFAYTTWQSALLTRTFFVSSGEAGQYVGMTALVAGTVGAWFGGVFSDRAAVKDGVKGRLSIVMWCAPALLVSVAILFVPNKSAAVIAFLAWQLIANVAYVAIGVSLQDFVTDRTRGLASSMQTCLSIGIGLGFGPTIVALINTSMGKGANALAPSLIVFVGSAAIVTFTFASLLLMAIKQRNQAQADPVAQAH